MQISLRLPFHLMMCSKREQKVGKERGKDFKPQIQHVKISNRIKPRKAHISHKIIKLMKIKDEKQILKSEDDKNDLWMHSVVWWISNASSHYLIWDKPDSNSYILCDSICMVVSNLCKTISTENISVVSRG